MYTPAGGVFFRVANHNQKIGDLNIQKGTLVSVGFYALQYSNLIKAITLKFLLNHLNLNLKDG